MAVQPYGSIIGLQSSFRSVAVVTQKMETFQSQTIFLDIPYEIFPLPVV